MSDEDKDEEGTAKDTSATTEGTEQENYSGERNPEIITNDLTAKRDEVPSAPRIRPNRLYRYLLNYGYFGHVLIMESIMAVEWFHVYTPMLPSLVNYIMHDILKFKRESSRSTGESLVSRTSGFLGADGSAIRAGRKKKAQTKKEDERALNQLRRLGDVKQVKYRFLSQSFMERHYLGPYGSNTEIEVKIDLEEEKLVKDNRLPRVIDEVESDSEWIVEALTQEAIEDEEPLGLPFDSSVGLSLGSDGPRVSVGVGFSIGESSSRKRSKKKSSSSISSLARQSTSSTKRKKSSGPRVSDREAGVMGRLRAAGANSLMGRSILGAYPGDLPPPQEAADANGLYGLAERYGYGDWSDVDNDDDADDDDDDDAFSHDSHFDYEEDNDDFEDKIVRSRPRASTTTISPKKKRTSSKTVKRQRRKKSQQGITVGFEFDLGSSSSSSSSSPSLSKPKISARRTSSTPSRSSSKAMEKLEELRGKGNSSMKKSPIRKDDNGSPPASTSKRVRPAMSLLEETKSKATAKTPSISQRRRRLKMCYNI